MSDYPSRLIEETVNHFAKLPGIGRKTALRLVLHILKQPEEEIQMFGESLINVRKETTYCKSCHNISDSDTCNICSDKSRDHSIICVVQDIRDVMAIENTMQYRGVYHVLGGVISPLNGVNPHDLNIESLIYKVSNGNIREIVFALSATMEGDTTNFYIYKKLKDFDIQVSSIARGVAIGNEIEYTDEVTLGRSIINRTPYSTLNKR